MSFIGVQTGYNCQTTAYQKTVTKSTGSSSTPFFAVSGQAAEKNDGKILGLTMIPDENSNVSYGMKAQYAANSTEENPIIQITSNFGGKAESYYVNIHDVDPQNASALEMFALCSYADDKGITDRGTFGSFQKLKYYADNATMNGYFDGVTSYQTFLEQEQDWSQMVTKMMDDYLKGGIYKQYQDGKKLLAMFDYFDTTKTSGIPLQSKNIPGLTFKEEQKETSSESKEVTVEDLIEKIKEMMEQIKEKIRKGETEPSFQIGASSFTEKEWDKLVENFDAIEETIRAQIKEEIEERLKIKQTKCNYPDSDSQEGVKKCVTFYSEDGIFCKEEGKRDGNLWAIQFQDASQYEKVTDFLSKLDPEDDLPFTADENFWKDFLDGKMSEEDLTKLKKR